MSERQSVPVNEVAVNYFTPRYSESQRVPKVKGSKGISFVCFSLVQTVTDLIPEIFRANPAIHFHGHLFNEIQAQALQVSDLGSWTVDTRDERSSEFLQHMLGCTDKLVGFYSRPEDWKNRPEVLQEIVNDPTITKVIITGDPIRSYAVFRSNLKRDGFSSADQGISVHGIQSFTDSVRKEGRDFYCKFAPLEIGWINFEDAVSDIERFAKTLFDHLLLPSVPLPSRKKAELSALAAKEMAFCKEAFLKRNTKAHEYNLIKYTFNLRDVDLDDTEELVPHHAVPNLQCSAVGSPKWGLLLPIQSTRGEYDTTRLKTFLKKLFHTVPIDERKRLTIQFGVDEDDPLVDSLGSILCGIPREVKCPKTILSHPKGHVCKIWKTLAEAAKMQGCDFFVLVGDDVTFETKNWMTSIEEKFSKISSETGLPFGVGCVAFNDISFPNFPSFPVIHRSHLEVFGELFNDCFINQGADPYLFELYNRLGAAVFDNQAKIRNYVGGNSLSPSRYQREPIRFKNKILTESLKRLREVYGEKSVKPTIDVVVPTYRLNIHVLDRIVNLRVSTPCQVKFWIIVDNPDHPNLSELQTRYDGRGESRNYTKQILVHPRNLGSNAARNTGIMRSSADWILFLDDDVYPQDDILDHYLSATVRYPDADAFAGVTSLPAPVTWWQRALHLSKVAYFYEIGSHMPHVPWSVTANLCVKGRTNPDVMFRLMYPKSGGGEDVDFCYRLKTRADSIISVPTAVVHHPWFANNAAGAFYHVMKWVTGDAQCVELLPEKTYRVWPGWNEFLLFAGIPALLRGVFLPLACWVIGLELLFKSFSLLRGAEHDGGVDRGGRIVAGVVAAMILMGQEGLRTWGHLQRFRLRALCRRLDWFDGMNMDGVVNSQRQHALRFTVYVILCIVLMGG